MSEETNIHVYGDTESPSTKWDERKKQILEEVAGTSANEEDSSVENNISLDRTVEEFDNSLKMSDRKREDEIKDLEKHVLSKDFTTFSSPPNQTSNPEHNKGIEDTKSEESRSTTPPKDDRFNLSKELSSDFSQFNTQKIVLEIQKLKQKSDEEISAALLANRKENELILEKQKLREASFDSAIKQAQRFGSQIEQLQHLQ